MRRSYKAGVLWFTVLAFIIFFCYTTLLVSHHPKLGGVTDVVTSPASVTKQQGSQPLLVPQQPKRFELRFLGSNSQSGNSGAVQIAAATPVPYHQMYFPSAERAQRKSELSLQIKELRLNAEEVTKKQKEIQEIQRKDLQDKLKNEQNTQPDKPNPQQQKKPASPPDPKARALQQRLNELIQQEKELNTAWKKLEKENKDIIKQEEREAGAGDPSSWGDCKETMGKYVSFDDQQFRKAVQRQLDNYDAAAVQLQKTVEKGKYIDVAMIALNRGGVPPFLRTVASLLHFVSVEVHLHVVVNNKSEETFRDSGWLDMLRDIEPHALQINFHHVSEYVGKVDTSIDNFRGGTTGTIYKGSPERLFPQLDRVLFVDTDTIFLRDAYDLWQEFDKMGPGQFLGTVFEYGTWYVQRQNGAKQWGNIEGHPTAGINAGLLLLDLKQMREVDWSGWWRREVDKHHVNLFLGDQDAYNLMVKLHPEIHYMLPTGWNAQLFSAVTFRVKPNEMYLLHGLDSTWAKTGFSSVFYLFDDARQKLLLAGGGDGGDDDADNSRACRKVLHYLRDKAPALAAVVHGYAYVRP